MPLAFSASIERASLQWQSYEVQTIAPGKELPNTRLRIELSNDFAQCFNETTLQCGILIDAPSIGIARSQLNVRQSCTKANTTIHCFLPPFTFRTTNDSIPISYVTQISGAVSQPQETGISLILDTTSPTLGKIQTGFCDGDQCFVAGNTPTPISVTFEDTLTSFQYRLVFLGKKASASIAQITECAGNTCIGNITIPCTDGEEFQMEMKSAGGITSREDAQNPILPATQPQTFTCKTKGPEILNITRVANGIAGQAVSGGTITFTARIRSPISQVTGILTAPNITGNASANTTIPPITATCRPASDSTDNHLHDCTWQVQQLNAGTYDVELRVDDALGLYDSAKERVTVLRLASAPSNGSLNLFSHKIIAVSPEAINRMALDLARNNYLPYPLYVTYELQKTKGNTRLFRQEIASCAYKLPNETNYTGAYNLFSFGGSRSESHILYPTSDGSGRNRLNLQIRAAPEVLAKSDTFNVRCTLALSVAEGDTLYSEPENETLTFDIRLRESPLGTPGQAFVDKIKYEEERLAGSDQEFLLKLREIRATMDGICTTIESINGAITLGTGVTNIIKVARDAAATNPFTAAAVPGLQAGLEGADKVTGTIDDAKAGTWYTAGTWIRNICYQVNCRGNVEYGMQKALQEQMPDILNNVCPGEGANKPAKSETNIDIGGTPASDVCRSLTVPNVEDSFVMSALSLCAGGMIYNAGKWQDINCGYLQCLKEQSLSGSSTAVCEVARGHKMCTQFVGEVFELPFVNIATNLAENVNGIIENLPQYVTRWLANRACKKIPLTPPNGDWKQMGCRWLGVALDALDYADATKRGFDKPMSDNAICLEALCNKEDGDCQLSYNRVEQLSEYTRYLQVNNWFVDQNRKSGGNAQKNNAGKNLFKNHDKDVREAYYASTACNAGSCVSPSEEQLNSFYFDQQSNVWRSESGVAGITVVKIGPESTQAMTDLKVGQEGGVGFEVLDKDNFFRARAYEAKHNALPNTVDGLTVPPAIANKPEYQIKAEQNELINERKEIDDQVQSLQQERDALLKKTDRSQREQNRLVVTGQELAQLTEKRAKSDNALKAQGITATTKPDGSTAWVANSHSTSFNSITPENHNALVEEYPELKDLMELNFVGSSSSSGGTYQCNQECQDKKITACKDNVCTYGNYQITTNAEGTPIAVRGPTDITTDVNAGATVAEPKPMSKFGILLVNTGIQILRDKGYLNFLSISYYGDWGIDLVEQSNTYLTKEGWANNICNDFRFDINDNEDGAVYILSESNNPQPIGTFAAEIRELSNDTKGKQKEYAYLLTALIDNPARTPPSGVSEQSWAERNTYRMDLKFLAPQGCTGCPQELDLINGTFELAYGGTFGSQSGPKKAIIYSNFKYTKVCITFDKEFPDINGKKTYCRDIKENVYERGSPSSLATQQDSTQPSTTPTSDGDGSLAGEIA